MMGRFAKTFSSLIVFSVVLPTSAFAAGAAHHGPPPGIESLLWPALNFVLYCWLVSYALRKKIRPALEMRARTIAERLQKAHGVLADAEAELSEVELRLEQVAEEKLAIIENLRNEGRNIAAEVRRGSEVAAANIRADVQRREGREAEQARAEIRSEVVQLATEKARKELEARLSVDDDKRLREEALRALF